MVVAEAELEAHHPCLFFSTTAEAEEVFLPRDLQNLTALKSVWEAPS